MPFDMRGNENGSASTVPITGTSKLKNPADVLGNAPGNILGNIRVADLIRPTSYTKRGVRLAGVKFIGHS